MPERLYFYTLLEVSRPMKPINKRMIWRAILICVILGLLGVLSLTALTISNNTNTIEELSKQLSDLEADYQQLENNYAKLGRAYANLQQEYNQLNYSYLELESEYLELETENRELQEQYDYLESFRLPKDIPGSPSLEDVEFLIYENSLLIKYPELELVTGKNTTSMHPAIGIGHSGIVTLQFDPDDLQVGNIIAYNSSSTDVLIAHRIIEIVEDADGKCYMVQGDSNSVADRECVQSSQIEYLFVGAIFSTDEQGYRQCPSGYVGVSIDDELHCISENHLSWRVHNRPASCLWNRI